MRMLKSESSSDFANLLGNMRTSILSLMTSTNIYRFIIRKNTADFYVLGSRPTENGACLPARSLLYSWFLAAPSPTLDLSKCFKFAN